jgi:hypothetical protein
VNRRPTGDFPAANRHPTGRKWLITRRPGGKQRVFFIAPFSRERRNRWPAGLPTYLRSSRPRELQTKAEFTTADLIIHPEFKISKSLRGKLSARVLNCQLFLYNIKSEGGLFRLRGLVPLFGGAKKHCRNTNPHAAYNPR